MKKLTSLLLLTVLLAGLLAMPAAQADTYATAVVKGGWLRLRAEASYDAATVSAYYTGTRVTIRGGSGEWYYVSTPDGKTGYMHSDFLTLTGSITGGQLSENTTAYVTSANGLSVRLRLGPSTQYGTIASYPVGTKLTVLVSGTDWCQVSIGGRTGYMMSKFITTTQGATPSAPSTGSYTAYVTSKNGLGVRLRSGAGKLYSTLATYSVGTEVTVLNYGPTWSKIRVGTLTGYMMSDFLTTRAPKLVASVTISDASVWPGETLRASIAPGDVTVSYEWLNDRGTRLGTNSTYTVRESDAGRKIRVRVTGKNGSTGTAISGWATVQGGGLVSTTYNLTGVTISDTTPEVGQTLRASIKPSAGTANITWFREDGVYVGSGETYTVHSSDVGCRLYAVAEGTGATTGAVASKLTSVVIAATGSVTPTPKPATSLRVDGVTLSDMTPTVGQKLRATVDPADAMTVITWYRDDDKLLGFGDSYTVAADDEGHQIYVWAEGTNGTFGSATSQMTSPVAANVTLITP